MCIIEIKPLLLELLAVLVVAVAAVVLTWQNDDCCRPRHWPAFVTANATSWCVKPERLEARCLDLRCSNIPTTFDVFGEVKLLRLVRVDRSVEYLRALNRYFRKWLVSSSGSARAPHALAENIRKKFRKSTLQSVERTNFWGALRAQKSGPWWPSGLICHVENSSRTVG